MCGLHGYNVRLAKVSTIFDFRVISYGAPAILLSFSFSTTGYVQCPSFDVGYMQYTNQDSLISIGNGLTFMECVQKCEIMQQGNTDIFSVELTTLFGSCSCHKRSSTILKINQYSDGPISPEGVACYLQRK